MNILREEYTPILILLVCSICLSVILFVVSYIVAPQKPDAEKISAYECGFDPYEDARNSFDIRFYLVAILFIIFDLEAMFFLDRKSTRLNSSHVRISYAVFCLKKKISI